MSTVVWQAEVDSWAVSILPSAEIGRNTIAATEQFDLAPAPTPTTLASCGRNFQEWLR
jgi:hypothetical protein